MKRSLTRCACLLPLVLTGCLHRHRATPPPPTAPAIMPQVEDATLSRPDKAPANLPPPVITIPENKPETLPPQSEPAKPKTPVQHKKTPPQKSTQQASSGAPEVSAIGQLSTGASADSRTETERSLNRTEHDLKGIHRKLSSQEQKTSAQIREYIKQARAALASNDLDGAQTLATKAKLLLGELTH